jgi:dihydroorotase
MYPFGNNIRDIFDREKQFINKILIPLTKDFPTLKITMEHISTKDAVDYIINDAPDTVKASVTCHHLLYNRNDLLVGGIKPHLYCLPILKELSHCIELCKVITSGVSNKFFLGTDSAPHITITKETACGCAGIYTAHAAIELYLEIFDQYDSLQHFENFSSTYGAQHYNIPLSTRTITFIKQSWIVPTTYKFTDTNGIVQTITPLRAGQEIQWQIYKEEN